MAVILTVFLAVSVAGFVHMLSRSVIVRFAGCAFAVAIAALFVPALPTLILEFWSNPLDFAFFLLLALLATIIGIGGLAELYSRYRYGRWFFDAE